MVALVVGAIGLAVVDPGRARPLTRPMLTVVGGVALTLIAIGGGVQLYGANHEDRLIRPPAGPVHRRTIGAWRPGSACLKRTASNRG